MICHNQGKNKEKKNFGEKITKKKWIQVINLVTSYYLKYPIKIMFWSSHNSVS
jgi:hypothetical protein